MMKKVVILVFSIIFIFTTNIYAGDLFYRLTHGDQDALVLATVKEVHDDFIKVNVEKTLHGEKVSNRKDIKIYSMKKEEPKFFFYTPKNNDFIIASIDKKIINYNLKWGLFKVSSLDYKTLKIIESKLPLPDNAAFNYYINSGCKVNDFYFKNGEVFIKKSDGEDYKIYPNENNNLEENIDTNEGKTLNVEKVAENEKFNFLVIGIVILSFSVLIFLNRKKYYDR